MRSVSLITWNPEEEYYEMSVKHLKVGDDTGDVSLSKEVLQNVACFEISKAQEYSDDPAYKLRMLGGNFETGEHGRIHVSNPTLFAGGLTANSFGVQGSMQCTGESRFFSKATFGSAVFTQITIGQHTLNEEILGGLIEGTGGGSSVDMSRFVSTHSQDDETTGDYQDILGDKCFKNRILVGDSIMPLDDGYWHAIGATTYPFDSVFSTSIRTSDIWSLPEDSFKSTVHCHLVPKHYLNPDTSESVLMNLGDESDRWNTVYSFNVHTQSILASDVTTSTASVRNITVSESLKIGGALLTEESIGELSILDPSKMLSMEDVLNESEQTIEYVVKPLYGDFDEQGCIRFDHKVLMNKNLTVNGTFYLSDLALTKSYFENVTSRLSSSEANISQLSTDLTDVRFRVGTLKVQGYTGTSDEVHSLNFNFDNKDFRCITPEGLPPELANLYNRVTSLGGELTYPVGALGLFYVINQIGTLGAGYTVTLPNSNFTVRALALGLQDSVVKASSGGALITEGQWRLLTVCFEGESVALMIRVS